MLGRPFRPDAVAAAALLFAALGGVLFREVLFGGRTLVATDVLAASPLWRDPPGPVRNRWLTDTAEYYYPAEKLASEHARRGVLPLSNPHVFNGAPVPHGVPGWQSLWPVKLAFLLLFDPVRSYDLYAILHWWLAGVSMAALLRGLGRAPFACLAGALAYALSGRAMLWLHGHYFMATLAYAPLAFLAFHRRSMLAVIPLAGLFFTHAQAGLAVSAAGLFLWPRAWRPALAAALMAGVALVPLAAAVQGGTRDPLGEAEHFYSSTWKCWLLPVELLAPGTWRGKVPPPNEYNVYVGLLPLVGACWAARREKYFAVLAGVAFAVATFWPLPVLAAPFTFSLPTRLLFLFTLGACVCFARALEERTLPPWVQAAVVVLLLADLGPRFARWNEPSDPAILRERPPEADLLRGRVGYSFRVNPSLGRPVEPPLSILGVESVQGYDVMVPRAQAEALRGAGRVVGDRVIVLDDPQHPALEALGMRTFVTDRPLPPGRFRESRAGGLYVYENPGAPEIPPREPSRMPLRMGLVATLAGSALACAFALLDRLRREGYS